MSMPELKSSPYGLLLDPAPSAPRYEHDLRHVSNMPAVPLAYNAYTSDPVLKSIIDRAGAGWSNERLSAVGALVGSLEVQELARLANERKPILHTHDRFGRRVDRVEYDPSWHELMRLAYCSGVHSVAWTNDKPSPQVARAAISYLWNQAENGIACPISMSFAIIPLMRAHPEIGAALEPAISADDYDPRHVPVGQKSAITIAMSMTEKQGGSDLRANTSMTAEPSGSDGEYVLNGHKFFCSAPMGDIVLLTARTANGVSLFVAPRILPDGRHNGIFLQRLKDKIGNRSNASAEIEVRGTLARMIGEDGHGIREFVRHMTHYIRLELAIGSAGLMRRALTLAHHHVANRQAFGKPIASQPQMVNTLADLAIETEAATRLAMRIASAMDGAQTNTQDAGLLRIGVPIAKYWICRRTPDVTREALECHGGMGYIEEQGIARLMREAPLNSIWEGTSAMMGLDFIRALRREPESRAALLAEIAAARGAESRFDRFTETLEAELENADNDLEPHARRLMSKTALALQASLMLRESSTEAAELFVASRLAASGGHELGTLDAETPTLARVVEGSLPRS